MKVMNREYLKKQIERHLDSNRVDKMTNTGVCKVCKKEKTINKANVCFDCFMTPKMWEMAIDEGNNKR